MKKMQRTVLMGAALLLMCGLSMAQMDNRAGQATRGEGTVNDMSNDPQQNQRLTDSMGTTTGGTYNGGVSDHSADLGGQASSSNQQSSKTNPASGTAGQKANVPPPGTGMEEKGSAITSSPGAAAATGPAERVKQQRNQKNLKDQPDQKGITSNEPKKKQ
jgi:hypothetical protein